MGKKRQMFSGKVIAVSHHDVVLPNGQACELDVVEHPGGAAVVAIDAQQRVCLLRQYRYVAGGWLWELPAGKLEPNEPPHMTAQRELEEEAGVTAQRWSELGVIWSSPGVFRELIYLYLARDLTSVATEHELHENIEVHWLPLAEALAWAREGKISDAKTIVGLLRAETRI